MCQSKERRKSFSRKSSRRRRLVRAQFSTYRGWKPRGPVRRGARPRLGALSRGGWLLLSWELAFQRSRKKTSSMPTGQQSISTPLVVGEPLVGGFPTDMDIDDDNLGLLDAHDAPSEKVDADFFNGELCHCARTLTPPALRRPPRALPSVAHMSSPTCPRQISRTTSMMTTWNEWHMRACACGVLVQASLHRRTAMLPGVPRWER